MNQKGFVNIIVILGVLIAAGTAGYFLWYSGFIQHRNGEVAGERNGHKLIRVQRCSDYCPPEIMEKSWVIEYAEGTTPQKCRDIGGYPKRDYAWGGYFGCSPDPVDPRGLYTEEVAPTTPPEQNTTPVSSSTQPVPPPTIPTTTSKKPLIVDHFACSDYCPGPAEKYTVKVYQGVTDPEECKKIGGKPSTYYGWGEFHICIAE